MVVEQWTRRWRRAWVVVAAACGLALAAFDMFLGPGLLLGPGGSAQAEPREAPFVVPGQRLWGELESAERLPFLVQGVDGMELSLRCKAWRGAALQPRLAVIDPAGGSIDVTDYAKLNGKGNAFSIDALPLSLAGTYSILVSGTGGTSGGFDLRTSARVAKKRKGVAELVGAEPVDTLLAQLRPGDRVRIKVSPERKSAARPCLSALVAPSGASLPLEGRSTAWIDVDELGPHRIEVCGDGDAAGNYRYLVRVKSPKVGRRPVDIREVAAGGTIRGRIRTADDTGTPETAAKPPRMRHADEDIVSGEMIVGGGLDAATALVRLGRALPDVRFSLSRSLGPTGPHLVEVGHLPRHSRARRRVRQTLALAKRAAAAPGIAWAEPNARYYAAREPNDPLFPQQFDMVQLNLPAAWDIATGSASVVVAIVDTGIMAHPDLDAVRVPGFDFVGDPSNSGDGDGWDADPTDDARNFHGLHVAGTVGAAGNDAYGVTGVAWGCRIQPVRALGEAGGASIDVAAAIRWAAGISVAGAPVNSTPAKVINLSLGSSAPSQAIEDACAEALSRGVVVIAAAGNSGSSAPFYPAWFPSVISVSSVDSNLGLASYSNFGSTIDVAAPGGDLNAGLPGILSTWIDAANAPSHTELQGTSMAAPHVAGVAALLLSAYPSLLPAEVRSVLTGTAVDLGTPGRDDLFGAGLVDAAAALRAVTTTPEPGPQPRVLPASLGFGRSTPPRRLLVTNAGGGSLMVGDVRAVTDDGRPWLSAVASGSVPPVVIDVDVDRELLVSGSWRGHVEIDTDEGVLDVPVFVALTEAPRLGIVRVRAFGPGGIEVATSATEGNDWAYELDGLPPGAYRIRVDADLDLDLVARRIDEFEGDWPLLGRPEPVVVSRTDLDVAGIDVPLVRRDARFTLDGAGGGVVDGAVAVRTTDAFTGAALPDVTVRLDSLGLVEDSDLTGRALFTGEFSGSQTVSVAAPGYESYTRAGSNSQFQGFPLRRLDAVASTFVDVTVRGVPPGTDRIRMLMGETSVETAVSGPGPFVLSIAAPSTRPVLPLVVVAIRDDVGPHAVGRADIVTGPGAKAADVTLSAPLGGMRTTRVSVDAASGAFPFSTYSLDALAEVRDPSGVWVPVAREALPAGGVHDFVWPVPQAVLTGFPVRVRLRARADFDASTTEWRVVGTTSAISVPEDVLLPLSPWIVSPWGDQEISAVAPVLEFLAVPGSDHQEILIEDLDDGSRHRIVVRGEATSVTVPVSPELPLTPGHRYAWSVTSSTTTTSVVGGYADDVVQATATQVARSTRETFIVR